jgi:hypothetical protein
VGDRILTGSDAQRRPTQLPRTVHGGKRDALVLATQMEVGKGRARPAGRLVGDVLAVWVSQSLGTWAPSSARDRQSSVKTIKADPITRIPLARLTVGDVERWHTRMCHAGYGDASVRKQHVAASLGDAVEKGR